MDSHDQSTVPLLVNTFNDERHNSAHNIEEDRGFGTMATKSFEAHERTVNEHGTSSLEMNNNGVSVDSRGEAVDNAVLEQELEALESKKKWYSYLSTKDFWIVLLIGLVLLQKQWESRH